MKVSEVLEAGYELIKDEKHWTQGAMAKDKTGNRIFFYEEAACQFCSMGALMRVLEDKKPQRQSILEIDACTLLEKVASCWSIADYNDSHTHAEVMAVWQRAIEIAKQKEGVL